MNRIISILKQIINLKSVSRNAIKAVDNYLTNICWLESPDGIELFFLILFLISIQHVITHSKCYNFNTDKFIQTVLSQTIARQKEIKVFTTYWPESNKYSKRKGIRAIVREPETEAGIEKSWVIEEDLLHFASQ